MDHLPQDKPLFTPGPLTTSLTVKQAMLRDLGSRDVEFIAAVRELRDELLSVAGVSQEAGYEAIIMQGSGTFSVEAVIATAMPPRGSCSPAPGCGLRSRRCPAPRTPPGRR